MFGLTIVKTAELQELENRERMENALLDRIKHMWPLIHDVERICKEHPEYLDGIAQGTVSIRFLAGYSPFKSKKKHAPEPVTDPEILRVYRKNVIGPDFPTTDQEKAAGLEWNGKELIKRCLTTT